MKKILLSFYLIAYINVLTFSIDNQVVWNVDNLSSIGGYSVTKYGNPVVISTTDGNAVEFDGINSRLQVQGFPISTVGEFTIEIIFKPYNSATSIQPRFLHAEEPAMAMNKRITIECRFDGNNNWYADTFLKDGTSNKTLLDATKIHSTDQWMHIALTYSGGTMKQYVNGQEEMGGEVNFTGLMSTAQVSLGGRMNNVNYLKGAIRKVIFTPQALQTTDFTFDGTVNLRNLIKPQNSLDQNFPNPFRKSTQISFKLAAREHIKLEVFNVIGVKVFTIIDGEMSEGVHNFVFNKGDLNSGIYIYKISSEQGYIDSKRMYVE